MWRHIAQSQQGRSHIADGTACQDSNRVHLFGEGSSATLVACVADGAGSAAFAQSGSEMACATIIENAVAYFEANGGLDDVPWEEVVRWCEDARGRIQAEADARGCGCREFATTLCVVIAAPERSVCFQIGDGAIILGNNGIYGVVFWPQSGEYANSTNFLTADDYQERLEFLATWNQWSDLAIFTDGLERIALQFGSRTPHAPFFLPLFHALRTTDNVDALNEDLLRFLASDSVQQRSDDDKTLILATRGDSDHAA